MSIDEYIVIVVIVVNVFFTSGKSRRGRRNGPHL